MNFRRLIPVLLPLMIWLLCQAFLLMPKIFLIAIAFGIILIIVGIKILTYHKAKRDWPLYFLAPTLFFLSASSYAAVIVSRLTIQIIFFLVVWFLFSYFKNIYYYLSYDAPERATKLEYLLVAGSFLTVFGAGAVLFDLPAFINWPVWADLIAFFFLFFLLLLQFLPFKKMGLLNNAASLIVVSIALAEFSLVLALLPLNFNVLALLLSVTYYFFLVALRFKWQDRLSRRSLKYPLILTIIISILLLLTANWL